MIIIADYITTAHAATRSFKYIYPTYGFERIFRPYINVYISEFIEDYYKEVQKINQKLARIRKNQ